MGSALRSPRPVRTAVAAACLTLLLGLSTFMAAGFAADEERGVLADLISRALSTPASRVTIGKIDGALSSSATIHDIAIQDRDGVWLKLDRARIAWRRLALVQRRLEIDDLDLGQLTILRKPIPAEAPVAGEDRPLLPELPVRVDIQQFALSEMILGQPILGTPARFSLGGHGKLGAPSEGLELWLDGQRLDRPASLTVRLSLVPDNQKLSLSVALNEPAGGLVSTLASIPGQPPVRLNLDGSGTLDAFGAKLLFDAGPDIAATGSASLNRQGTARRLGLDLAAQIAGLLPGVAAPVFAGTTTLKGDVVFGDDSNVVIPGVALGAAAARLDIAGRIDPSQVADLTIAATNLPNQPGATALGDAAIRKLAFKANLTGPLAAPTIASTLSLQDARLPSGSIERLEARLQAVPTGSISDTATLLRFDATASASGLKLANPSLAQAVGSEASFATRGTSTLGGVLDFDSLDLKAQTLTTHYAGRASSAELRGHLDAEAPDLARFGAVAGVGIKGSGHLSADVEGTPRSNRFTAQIKALTRGFATGLVPLDGLFGGALALTGGVRLDPDGGFGFDQLQLIGPNATAQVNGAATPALADLTAVLDVPDLRKADARLTGRGHLDTHVTGTLDRPNASATVGIANATLIGRAVPQLTLAASATDLRGDPVADLKLDGLIDGKPARASLRLRHSATGGTALDNLDARVGSVVLQGDVSLDAEALAEGRLSAKAGDLDDLSALALQKLSGSLDAQIALSRQDGGQNGSLKASASQIEASGIKLERLAADLRLADLYRHPVLDGGLTLGSARIGDQTVSGLRLNANGSPAASDVTLAATVASFAVDARARIVPASPIRVELSRLDVGRGTTRISLERPSTVTLADGGADFHGFGMALAGGRMSLDGHAGSRLNLKTVLRAVPLSLANLAVADLGLSGTLDGEASLAGAPSAPTGTYDLRVTKLTLPQTRSVGLPPIDANASGRLEGARATTQAQISAATAGSLTLKGSVPLSGAGSLDLNVAGKLDAALANHMIAAGGRRLTGSVTVDARLGGPLQHPLVTGAATLADGTFTDAVGIRLDALQARMVARGDRITLESASAATRNGGSMAATGQIRLDAAAGFPGSLRITGQKAQLIQSNLATAVVDLDLQINGPLARQPRLGGKVDILSLDVPVPERLPGRLQPLPGTRHLRPTRTAAARLAVDAKKNRKGTTAFDMGLDLAVAVPGQIHVYGRGLDAQLGGGLRLTGTLGKPRPVGAFSLVRGRLQVLTANLDFSRANLTFAGDLSPELDFLATTQAAGATISIAITGLPSDPQFDFTSNPTLPQDEILSRLLFGAPSGQLSTTQALSLASAAAQYSTGGGGDALEGLRRSLGLGAASASSNPLTRALGNRVSVGVHTGVTPADTGVGVDISVYGPLKVKGAVNATGGTSAGIGAEHEW